jgi:predicted  nucleic acid-binding Zn-ribbon protein
MNLNMAQTDIVKRLANEVERLIANHEQLMEKCRKLEQEREALTKERYRLQERIREQEEIIKHHELAGAMRGGDDNVERARARVNSLLREVDRCIAAIKHEQEK